MSARLIAGPSTLPDAFDELVTIVREDPPGPPTWSPANLDISITADSVRGVSPVSRWSVGGVPIPTAIVAAGERVAYTVRVENLDALDSPNLYVDAWPLPEDYIGVYFGFPDRTDGVAYGLISGTTGTTDYGGGIEWTGAIPSGSAIEFSYWVEMPADMAPGDDHTSGVDVYVGTSPLDPWIGWALAGGYYRAFEYGFDGYKMSDPFTVLPGDTFTYNIHLANYSAEDRDAYFSDPLPDEVTFVSATGGATYDAGTHTVTWTGSLPGTSLSTVDFDIVVQAEPDLAHGTLIENEVTLAYKLGGTPFATIYAYTVVDMSTDVSVEKTVDVLGGFGGDLLTFHIFMQNEGTQAATGAALNDVIPAYLSVIPNSLTIDMGDGTVPLPAEFWDEETGVLRWEGSLPAGATYIISFQATVDEDAPVGWAIINMAEFSADNAMVTYDSALTEVLELFGMYLPIVTRNY